MEIPPPSTIEPDWSREKSTRFWHPSAKLLKAIRDYQKSREEKVVYSRLQKKWAVIRHRFWSVVCGCDIPINVRIGGGLRLPHPNGVVIHPDAKIGVNCLILQQVTLVKGVELGGNVDLGAGSKIVRAIKIGDRAKVGANAVVLTNVPPACTVVGIPAKVITPKAEHLSGP